MILGAENSSGKIIHLMGPTASGKTDLAIALARTMPIEIVSVDSALVYQGLDIGSAKPSQAIQAQIPHHLIDMISPEEAYSVAAFLADAKKAIAAIQARGNIPLLVGGTMLYFKALLEGLAAIPAIPAEIRTVLKEKLDRQGLLSLHQELQMVDPLAAMRIHQNDAQRVTRALEVYYATQQPLSYWLHQSPLQLAQDQPLQISLMIEDRTQLHHILSQRFHFMLQQGLVHEVEKLKQRYALNADLSSMRCVGYRQVWQYLAGTINYSQMVDTAIAASRQLAKRQLTWLRSWQNQQTVMAHQEDTLQQLTKIILDYIHCSSNAG